MIVAQFVDILSLQDLAACASYFLTSDSGKQVHTLKCLDLSGTEDAIANDSTYKPERLHYFSSCDFFFLDRISCPSVRGEEESVVQ